MLPAMDFVLCVLLLDLGIDDDELQVHHGNKKVNTAMTRCGSGLARSDVTR